MRTKIMLDAGHGGKASGTVHQHPTIKVVEKEINLKIALYARRYIKQNFLDTITPYITRLHDDTVSLRRRCEMANLKDVQLFLSIHCNSRPQRGKHGVEIETFYQLEVPDKPFALRIQDTLVEGLRESVWVETPIIYRRVAEANFYVLRNTFMTSALVECGFLCDEEEALFLSKERTQRQYGKWIAKGIYSFLND